MRDIKMEFSRMPPEQQDMMDWNWTEPVREREEVEPCYGVGVYLDVETFCGMC
jgi:hypothetical protein